MWTELPNTPCCTGCLLWVFVAHYLRAPASSDIITLSTALKSWLLKCASIPPGLSIKVVIMLGSGKSPGTSPREQKTKVVDKTMDAVKKLGKHPFFVYLENSLYV